MTDKPYYRTRPLPPGQGKAATFLDELILLIGEPATLALIENFAGTRLYVPVKIMEDRSLVAAIGEVAAAKLSGVFAPDTIRVPLAREFRATHYRAAGLSLARIAVKLGMTETGEDKLFKRLKASEG